MNQSQIRTLLRGRGNGHIKTKGAFYPEDGLPLKHPRYFTHHLGKCCVRNAEMKSRSAHYCRSCGMSRRLAYRMMAEGVVFLQSEIVSIGGVEI